MKRFFTPNIDARGRIIRGLMALMLFAVAAYGFTFSGWLGLIFVALGVFASFEALRGWCAMRACGVKTRY
ncbi:MAG TPA: YgaP-like transmembrane domain [Verrucomicrobiae bacterium]|nr:YgaP-like transmembrane domain [Verrucomicrobiae bacterium]